MKINVKDYNQHQKPIHHKFNRVSVYEGGSLFAVWARSENEWKQIMGRVRMWFDGIELS